MCVVAGIFIVGYHVIVDTALVVYLIEEHGLSESYAGNIFLGLLFDCLGLMFSISYIGFTSAYLVYPFASRKFHQRGMMFTALFMKSLCMFVCWGPSMLLQMPK